jgi:hypothetical protein
MNFVFVTDVTYQQFRPHTAVMGDCIFYVVIMVAFNVLNLNNYTSIHFLNFTFIFNGPFKNIQFRFHCVTFIVILYLAICLKFEFRRDAPC